MRMMVMACGFVLMTGTAAAQDMEALQALQVAVNLGNVIGSEEFCGLSYKQEAIEAFIASKVDASDMSFSTTFETAVQGRKIENDEMTPSQKTAHCAQTRRVAKQYGFTD